MQGRLDFSLLRFPRPKENLIISQLEFLYIVVIVEKNSAQPNIVNLKKINMGHQLIPVTTWWTWTWSLLSLSQLFIIVIVIFAFIPSSDIIITWWTWSGRLDPHLQLST